MKKRVAILLALLLTLTIFTPVSASEITEASTEHPETTEYPDDPTREPELVSNSAIVMDAATGQILYEKNPKDKKYPASITKILTVLLALEHNVDFNETITMSENSIWGVERDSTLIGLDVGEQVTIKDLVYATMVKSANECAYALAEYVAGDIESFANLMNERAKEIGCENTHFVTPNGLHDDNHYTTAYDMALITKEALKNDTFREIAGTLNYTVPATNLTDETRPLWNGNKMINPMESYYYEYCEGGKTGYTTAAHNTLVTFSKKDGLELICVVLDCDGGAKYAYTDSRALYNYCYNNYTYYHPLSDFSFETDEKQLINDNPILNNYYTSLDHDMIDLSVDKEYSLLLNKSTDISLIERTVTFYDKAKDDVLGEITFTYDGEQIGSTPITSETPLLSSQMSQNDEPEKTSIWNTIGKIALRIAIVIGALLGLLVVYMIFAAIIRKIKRNRRRRSYRRRYRRRRDDDYYF